jgi:hypothetical protein
MGMRHATRLRRRVSAWARGRATPAATQPDGRVSAGARSLRVAALAAVLAPVGIVMATADDSPVQPPESALQAPAVTWSGRVFLHQDDLASWLAARGGSYATWAELHPAAAYELERNAR